MTTHSLNHILRRWLVSLSGVLLGLTAAMLFVLSLNDRPHSAQAADSPLPIGNEAVRKVNADRWAIVKDRLTQDGSVGSSALTLSPVLTLTGAVSDSLGFPVATADDVNGDGYADVIVGAPDYYSSTGRVRIYLGSASGLSTVPILTATGEATGDLFGDATATAGDVNGDGYADIIIGAPYYDAFTGRAYIYLGSASGLSATPAFTITGEAKKHYFGGAVSTAGDVNGDGYSDVVIGAGGANRVYLYTGSPSGLSAALVITGTGGFGGVVGTAGDVNGDGYADVIASAGVGQVTVYHGSASGLNATPAFTATGETIPDFFGASAGTAGDVNGDGYADVIIGAYGQVNNTGKAYLYFGSASGLPPTPTLTLAGEGVNSWFGFPVATAGDMNGDGYSEVIIGAPEYLSGTGRAYVYSGSATGLSASPTFTVTGETASDAFGLSAASAGDVNGDGYSDIIVGAPRYNDNTGRAYVYLGAADAKLYLPLISR